MKYNEMISHSDFHPGRKNKLSQSVIEEILLKYPNIPVESIHRIGLMLFGAKKIKKDISSVMHPIILGKLDEDLSDARDIDSRRITVPNADNANLRSLYKDTPYTLDDEFVLFNGQPILKCNDVPTEKHQGPFYARTDKLGIRSRIVINPQHEVCPSQCKFCSRSGAPFSPDNRPGTFITERKLYSVDEMIDVLSKDESLPQTDKWTELVFMTNDFPDKSQAFPYVKEMIEKLKYKGFKGGLYYGGHQITKENEMKELVQLLGEGKIRYALTVECVENRITTMPSEKGQISLAEIDQILQNASNIFGKENSHYYLVLGLDTINVVQKFIDFHKNIAIPELNVFMNYRLDQEKLLHPDNRDPEAFLNAIINLQNILLRTFGHPVGEGSNRGIFPLRATGDKHMLNLWPVENL